MTIDVQKTFDLIGEEERELTFDTFSRDTALELGLTIIDNAKSYDDPITVEITVNGLSIFRFFAEGSIPDSNLWLTRKRNSVDLMHMSSLRFKYWLEMNGWDLNDRKVKVDDFAPYGGGFPVAIKGSGVIGSICVSGLPSDEDDHKLITDSIKMVMN